MANERDNATVSRVNPDEARPDKDRQEQSSGSGVHGNEEKSKSEQKENSEQKKTEQKGSGVHDDNGKKKKGAESESESRSDKKAEREKQKRDLIQRLRQIRMAAQAATAAARFVMLAKLLNTVKMLLQMLATIIQSLTQMSLGSLLMMLGQAIAHVFMSGVVMLAGFLGSTVATAATIIVAGIVAVAVAVGAVVGSLFTGPSVKDDATYDCNTDKSFMQSGELSATAEELEVAKTVYAVLKAWGLPDTNIAGVLGNWSCESNIDPTGVETIYSEPRIIPVPGTKKGEAWYGSYEYGYEDPFTHECVTTIVSPANFLLSTTTEFGKYGLRTYVGDVLNAPRLARYSDDHPASHYMGIGLGQWTNDRNRRLMAYADAHDGFEWYDLELQLMFMIDQNGGDSPMYVKRLGEWTEEPTASSAAEWFCEQWEGITCQPERLTKAEGWYTTIKSWQEGVDYDLTAAESLISSILSAGRTGSNISGSGALRSCSGYVLSANDSAATAALSFAWGPGDAYDNVGTDCWKQIFGAIVGDEYIRCCDRTVACAIKWSGTDSDYPNGSTQNQLVYLLSSPRWQKVEWGGDPDNLLPGDVLIRNDAIINVADGHSVGHTLMYVGLENVIQQFGEEYNGINVRERGYCFVSGSINRYSPHVQCFTTSAGANDLRTYYAFRNVEKYNARDDWTSLTCVGDGG